jgi:hypothetical protein
LTGAVFDILVDFYLDRLVAFGLVKPALAQRLRRAAATDALAGVDDQPLRDAYKQEPAGFKAALADARDMVGLRLAETFHRLQADGLSFERVARPSSPSTAS